MRQKTIFQLGAVFCLSFASLAGSQTTPEGTASVPQDKVALLAAERASMKQQNQVLAEKSRIINAVSRLPQNQRKKALADEMKNSRIFQQARESETGANQAQGLGKANAEVAVPTSEIIAGINRLPPAERKFALREAMRALKGKKLENAQ